MSKQKIPQEAVTRSEKKYFLSLSKRQVIIFILVFSIIGGGAILYNTLLTRGANYSWFQTTWLGGASTTAIATHADNQSGWTRFFSKDTNMSTSTDGQLSLTATNASTTDTATADFSAGTASNTYVDNGTVKLKKPNGVACTTGTECVGNACASNKCVSCNGIWYNNRCFYLSATSTSCSTLCSSHGGSAGAYYDDSNCTVLKFFSACTTCFGVEINAAPYIIVDMPNCNRGTGSGWSVDTASALFKRLCACNE